jgi:hypothetical protein
MPSAPCPLPYDFFRASPSRFPHDVHPPRRDADRAPAAGGAAGRVAAGALLRVPAANPFDPAGCFFVAGLLLLRDTHRRCDLNAGRASIAVLSPERAGGWDYASSLPWVGLGRGRRRSGGVGSGVDPLPLDGGFSAAHLHPALAGLHRCGQCAVLPAHGPVAADPSTGVFPGLVPDQRRVLVVFRVPQPLRAKLVLCRGTL